MDAQEESSGMLRVVGTMALMAGLLAGAFGLRGASEPGKGYIFIGLLVMTGIGLRLEAALRDRRG